MNATENNINLDTLKEHKCPNCLATISFDSKTQKMACSFCDSEFDVLKLEEFTKDFNTVEKEPVWDLYEKNSGSGDWQDGEKDQLKSYICNSCAGEIMTDNITSATHCPYCDNAVIIANNLDGNFRPDLVIPFELDKEQAKNAFVSYLKSKKLLPKKFQELTTFDDITGIYVPFWLYNCKTQANLVFDAKKVRTWNTRDFIVRETSHYNVKRSGVADFEKIPADGSIKFDDTLMEAIEPFDYSKAVDFKTAYLSGFLAEKYDVLAEENLPRINNRITSSIASMIQNTVKGYSHVSTKRKDVEIKKGDISYALLPIWILNADYNGEKFMFSVNGQTGKFVGNLPICNKKCFAYFGGVFAVSFVVMSLITMLF